MKRIFITILFILTVLTSFLLITKNVVITIEEKPTSDNLNYYFTYTENTFVPSCEEYYSVVVDEKARSTFSIVTNTPLKKVMLVSLDENLETEETLYILEDIPRYSEVSFRATLSETIPNYAIIIISENYETQKFIPMFNGKDGGYYFEKIN